MKKLTELDRNKAVLYNSNNEIWSLSEGKLVGESRWAEGIFNGGIAAAEQYRKFLESCSGIHGLSAGSLFTFLEKEIPVPTSKFKQLVKGEHRVAFSLPQKGKAKRALFQIDDLMKSGYHVLSTVRHNKDLGMHLNDIRDWNLTNSQLSPANVTNTSPSTLRLILRCDEPRLFVGLSGAYTWRKMLTAINNDKSLAARLGLVDDEGCLFPLGLLILDPDARNKGEIQLHKLMEIAFAIMKLTATPGPLLMSDDTTIAEQVQSQKIPGYGYRGFAENNFVPISLRHGAFDVSHPDFRKFWKNELTQGQEFSSLLINASMWCDGHFAELLEISRHHRQLPGDTHFITMNHTVARMYDKRMRFVEDFSSRPKDADGYEFGRPYADIQKAYSYCEAHGINHIVVAGKLLVTRAGRFMTQKHKRPLTALFNSSSITSHLEEATQALGRTCGMVPVGTPKATNYCADDLYQEVTTWNYTDLPKIATAINQGIPVDNVQMVGQYGRDLTRRSVQDLLEYQLFNHSHRGKNYGDY